MKGYQLKITLKGTSPPVWRRIWIPADMTFRNLHEAIQYLFGWMDYHLYDFEIAREHVKILCDDGEAFEFERDTVFKDMDTPLHTYLKEKMKLVYTYDYGDNWEHVILVEKQSEEAQSQIKLLKWKQDNLAEDAGNVDGYQEIVAKAADETNEEHEKMKNWLEMQHIPFDEEIVREDLASITQEDMYFTLSPEAGMVLNEALAAFIDQLDKMELCGMSLITADDQETKKVLVIAQYEEGYNMQLYENETDYMRGVESTPELPGYNLYANGVSIICLDQGFQRGDGWVSEDGTCIVKIMQTGYLPMDPDDEAAYEIANDLHDFLNILQSCGHRNLPDYNEGRMLSGIWKKDGTLDISYPEIRMLNESITLHLQPDQAALLNRKKKTIRELQVDLIADLLETVADIRLPLYLTLENEDYQLKIPLDDESYRGFEEMSRSVVSLLCGFMEEYGRITTLIVNNDNMAQMLSGLCEDLSIKLRIEDFMSEAQKLMMEEDLHHDFEMLNTLAGMSEEEFYQFLDQLDEHQLEGFSQMIEQYMDKYGLDSEHDSPLPKLKAKKHFDA